MNVMAEGRQHVIAHMHTNSDTWGFMLLQHETQPPRKIVATQAACRQREPEQDGGLVDSRGDATRLLRGRIGQVDIGSVVGVKSASGEAGGDVGEVVGALRVQVDVAHLLDDENHLHSRGIDMVVDDCVIRVGRSVRGQKFKVVRG
jgi:hypothetical protein